MVSSEEVIRIFEERGALLHGHFLLASGKHSDAFLQAARVIQYPHELVRLCGALAERFRDQNAKAVYQRFQDKGRMAPEGLTYVGSWIEANFDRCFQLMECDDVRLLQEWVTSWSDLADFEIVPVVPSKETAEVVYRVLARDKG